MVFKSYVMKLIAFFSFIIILVLLSCAKPQPIEVDDQSVFYGRWVNTYGDTSQFTRLSNGRYVLLHKEFCPNSLSSVEFIIVNTKLALKDDVSNPAQYRVIESFNWLQTNRVFEVKAHDWYPCVSNDFKIVFTKIM